MPFDTNGHVSADRRAFLNYSGVAATSVVGALSGCVGGDGSDDEGSGNWHPSDTVTILISYEEGSTVHSIATVFQEALDDLVDVDIVVESLPGAALMRGAGELHQNREPDGHTISLNFSQSLVFTAVVNEVDWDPREFEGIINTGQNTFTIHANSRYEVEGLDDLYDRYEDGKFEQIVGIGHGHPHHVTALILRDDHRLGWEEYIHGSEYDHYVGNVVRDEVPVGMAIGSNISGPVRDGEIDLVASLGDGPDPEIESWYDGDYDIWGEERESLTPLTTPPAGWLAPPGTPDSATEFWQNTIREALEYEVVQNFQEDVGYVFDFYADRHEVDEQLETYYDTVTNDVDIEAIREEA